MYLVRFMYQRDIDGIAAPPRVYGWVKRRRAIQRNNSRDTAAAGGSHPWVRKCVDS